MSINPSTEILHPDLGPIRFDDGKVTPPIAAAKDTAPKWVCRPDGWDSEFEIYVPGNSRSPQDLERAVVAVRHREHIEAEGKRLSASNVYLSWIDMTTDPPSAAFLHENQVYEIWRGRLDNKFQVRELKKGAW